MACEPKKLVEELLKEISDEKKKLLYMVGLYSKVNGDVGKQWLKDLALRGLISKGIRDGIFDWDYAPASIMYRGSRKVINVSQEGQNDLIEMREDGLVARLRLGTSKHFYFNAFNLTEAGVEAFDLIPKELREPVDKLVHCASCGALCEVMPLDKTEDIEENDFEELDPPEEEEYKNKTEGIYMVCRACKKKLNTRLDWIEAVGYECKAKWPKIKMVTEWEKLNEE